MTRPKHGSQRYNHATLLPLYLIKSVRSLQGLSRFCAATPSAQIQSTRRRSTYFDQDGAEVR